MKILVTGGLGYIGSHTIVELLFAAHDVIVIDNLSNSHLCVLDKIEEITGVKVKFYNSDIRDDNALKQIFNENEIDNVIHFAGLKSVSESVKQPLSYYNVNVVGTINLIAAMKDAKVNRLIFSSSATVYGANSSKSIVETDPIGGTTNAYGTSKLFCEKIIEDYCKSDSKFKATILRYFNPVGAHPSGLIGEDPTGIPANLVPYITQVAVKKIDKLRIYGADYDTMDGTGVRDFIHIMDLAKGHLAAINCLPDESQNYDVYNLGTGQGYSVLQVIAAFEKNSGISIKYEFSDRRAGDIGECWSNPDLAFKKLKWKAIYNLDDMMRDSWNWQSRNPNGFNEQ